MIGLFKDFFSPREHGQKAEADQNYERLMDTLHADELALAGIEDTVRDEFRAMDEDVKKMEEEIGETLAKTDA